MEDRYFILIIIKLIHEYLYKLTSLPFEEQIKSEAYGMNF